MIGNFAVSALLALLSSIFIAHRNSLLLRWTAQFTQSNERRIKNDRNYWKRQECEL